MSPLQDKSNVPSALRPGTRKMVGIVFIILFGVAFLLVSLFLMKQAFTGLFDHLRMRSWVETPARILEARLIVDDDSDGTMYGIKTRYQYAWRGQMYDGTRVDTYPHLLEPGGDYQRRVVSQLQAAISRGEAVPCYVNPKAPAQAVLFREMRWGNFVLLALFPIPFMGGGLASLCFGLYSWRRARQAKVLRAQYPGEPWRWREDWAAGQVRSFRRYLPIGLTGAAAYWNFIVLIPVLLGDAEKNTSRPGQPGWLWFVQGVGIWLILLALRSWLRWRRLGDPVFQLARVPGAIGGALAGTIHSSWARRPNREVQLKLACIRTVGDGDSSHKETLWEAATTVPPGAVHPDVAGILIPVAFQIPAHCEATDPASNTAWHLELQGEFAGKVAKAKFEVPVFETETGEWGGGLAGDGEPQATLTPQESAALLADSGASITPLPGGGRRFSFRPTGESKKSGIFMMVFAVIWLTFVTHFFGFMDFESFHPSFPKWPVLIFHAVELIFSLVFAGAGFFLAWTAFDLMLWSGWVEAGPEGLAVLNGIFFKSGVLRIPRQRIRDFSLEKGMSKGEAIRYNIELAIDGRKKLTLAKRIADRRMGEYLIAEIRKDLNSVCAGGEENE